MKVDKDTEKGTQTQLSPPPLKPPLKWAGGKRWLLPYLRPIWDEYKDSRLVEPLCGGLAVSFGLMPRRALINDANPHLVNFYRWLKRGLTIKTFMRNDSDMFYGYRKQFNMLVDRGEGESQEAAELFYYLNQTGYNGLCRLSRRGEFNVPFGRHGDINYRTTFRAYKNAMKEWEFACGDFEYIALRKDDFVYADPPYVVGFNQYSPNGFSWNDQERLAKWLANHDGPIILSNHATERVLRLYGSLGFSLCYLNAPRRISCDGNRTAVREVVATKRIKWGTDARHPSPTETD